MGGSSEEEQSKKKRSGSGDDSCNFCGRTKRTMSPIYSRSISFPSSSARPRPSPSPFLCRSKSDISPLSSFPSLWNHISSPTTAPNLATPPAPAPATSLPPPAAMITPEKETSPWEKSNKSSVSPPPAAAGNASPVADLSPDPSAEASKRSESFIAFSLLLLMKS